MSSHRLLRGTVGTLLIVVAACVTVNIYFPAAEVQRAADKIVEEVRSEPNPPSPEATPSKPQGQREGLLDRLTRLWLPSAEAGVDIDISSPAIRNLRSSIKARFPALRPLYEKGMIGENNRGYLETRELGGVGLKEKGTVNRLVEAENADRRALYEEIVRANKLDSRVLSEVERLFAKSWREKNAERGWWIQRDDGSWTRR